MATVFTHTFTKSPSAVLDYERTWDDWLASGETIVSSVWTIAPSAGTVPLIIPLSLVSGTSAFAWVSGGDADIDYILTNRITTNSTPVARTDERSFRIRIRAT